MIARIWRGVRLEDAEEYGGYIRETGFTYYEVVDDG
jgi:hypothetical protein